MATLPTQAHPLLTIPFSAATDFTVLADYCENFAETLIENDDPALKMALCGRIHACLALLQPTLLEPVPPHLIESLTVDTLPATVPRFEPECTELCHYCLALIQALAGQGFSSETGKYLSWHLYDLISYFAAEMKAPRWLRTTDGVEFIECFTRTYRSEILDFYQFRTLNEAREITARWLMEYNSERPHESLNNLTLEKFRLMAEKPETSKVSGATTGVLTVERQMGHQERNSV